MRETLYNSISTYLIANIVPRASFSISWIGSSYKTTRRSLAPPFVDDVNNDRGPLLPRSCLVLILVLAYKVAEPTVPNVIIRIPI